MIYCGDIVSRNKYNNDLLFVVDKIVDNKCYLTGLDVRLCADSNIEDLKKEEKSEISDSIIFDKLDINNKTNNNYFYIPGKILHIDSDEKYLKRCLKLYKKANILAYGVCVNEEDIYLNISKYLNDINPNIVIITGHDAYYEKKGKRDNIYAYKNSKNFEKAILVARNYEKSYEKLIIIAGACQSDYEALINAGSNFASSPKRINIHALDPAIVGILIALTEYSKEIDLENIIDKTNSKEDGIGGIKTNGTMHIGYPKVI